MAFVQIDKTLYEVLAKNYAESRGLVASADAFLTDALIEIVDITTSGYAPGIQAAIDVELALLEDVNDSLITLQSTIGVTTGYHSGVRAGKNYVINNSNEDTTDVLKLTNFVNSIDWTGSIANPSATGIGENKCPYYWAELSNNSGFDVSLWVVALNPLTGEQDFGVAA